MREWRYSSTILDLGTRRGLAVSFTALTLYILEKSPRYPLDRRLVGPQSALDAVEKRKILHCRQSSPAVQPETRRYTD
jgi:hypothetical protein